MHAYVLHTFAYVSAASAASPFVDSFMDGCVGVGEAADAAKTYANVCKT